MNNEVNTSEGWFNIFKLIMPYIFIVGTIQLIAIYTFGIEFKNYQLVYKTPFQQVIVSVAGLIGTLIVIWLMMKFVDEKPFYTLGFKNSEIGRDLALGVFVGFIIMFFGFFTLYFTNQIQVKKIEFDIYSFFAGLLLFISVGITEEVLVRGYILKNLLASFNQYISLLISAVLFSILHLGNDFIDSIGFFQLFVGGLLLGIPYVITQKLWFSIALHFSWNFFQGTIFGFNVSGNQQYSIVQGSFKTATVWNGGNFGFEGSLLCLLFQMIAIGFVLYMYNYKSAFKLYRFEKSINQN